MVCLRNIKTYWLHLNVFLEASVEETSLELAKEICAKLVATSGFSDDYALGDEGAAAWWLAANLPRLEALKHLGSKTGVWDGQPGLYYCRVQINPQVRNKVMLQDEMRFEL